MARLLSAPAALYLEWLESPASHVLTFQEWQALRRHQEHLQGEVATRQRLVQQLSQLKRQASDITRAYLRGQVEAFRIAREVAEAILFPVSEEQSA